jgi:hypothetical protein
MDSASHVTAEFQRRLSETLAWCQPRFDPARAEHSLRNPELDPSRNIVHQVSDLGEIAEVVADVLTRRRALVGPVPSAARLPAGDRVLAFLPRDSLFHGSSPPQCDGFIDVDEIPPWGSWVLLVDEVLLSWVPAAMVDGVNSAIQCNAEGSIRWAASLDSVAIRKLRTLGLLA